MNMATSYEKTGRTTWIITIDGPAAAGKSTVSKLLAKKLGFLLLDSGALYRGLALYLIRNNITPDAPSISPEILQSSNLRIESDTAGMKLFLGGEDISRLIREEQVGTAASRFSTKPEVREALLQLQQSAALKWNLVAEGRDMGTVIFPSAQLKFFLSANSEERSLRRCRELMGRGETPDPVRVRREMEERDRRDRLRDVAPLIPASDAIMVDSTNLDSEQVVEYMMTFVREKLPHLAHAGIVSHQEVG